MFCSNCGKELVPEAKFCPNCGTPVSVVNNVAADNFDGMAVSFEMPVMPENDLAENTLNNDIQTADVTSGDLQINEVLTDDSTEETYQETIANGNVVEEEIDNSEVISELENTIPNIVSYGNTVYSGEDTQNDNSEMPITEAGDIMSDTSSSVESAEPAPVQIPAAFRVNTDQPVYVQEQTNVAPPDYAKPTESPVTTQAGQNPPKVKNGKKSKLPLIIALVLVIAAIVGYFVYQNSPSVKFDKAMTAGETAYQNGDYSTALDEFHKAYDIKPDDEVTQADLFSCYDVLAEQAYDKNDYASCIAYYEEAKAFCPNEIESCNTFIQAVYSDWCLNTASDGDIDGAEKIYAEALGAGYDMTATRENLDVIIATAKLMEEGAEAAQYLAENIDSESLSYIMLVFTNRVESFVDEYLETGGDTPVIFDIEGCAFDKLGFYDLGDGSYSFYYGEYNGELREGHGKWFVYSPQGFGSLVEYSMEGEWSGDTPNGEAEEHYIFLRNSSSNTEYYMKSTVVNGLYNGTVTWDYEDDDEIYTGSFKNGIVDVIDTIDPNGNASNVIAYNEDKSAWLYRQEDRLGNLNGIWGFR